MKVNSDFRDLLRELNAAGVRYLVVGGYAVMVYTEPRFTKDLDLWIDPTLENAKRVLAALERFGAPLGALTAEDLTQPEVFFQIGVDPVRIDLMTSNPGLHFVAAYERRREVDFGGESAPVISREDLIVSKALSGRRVDKSDLRQLRRKPTADG